MQDEMNDLQYTRPEDPDIVKVVRCKDCKYWDDFLDKGYCKDTIGFDRWWKPNDYCSYGRSKHERKSKSR